MYPLRMVGQNKSIAREPRQMFHERAFTRHQVAIPGKVLSPDLSSCVGCTVKDVSEGGVLVSLADQSELSDRIYLWQAETGVSIPCEVRWQKLNLVGLKFADVNSPAVRALTRICLPPSSRIEPMPLHPPRGTTHTDSMQSSGAHR
jgi:hypothetical protein